MSFPTNPEIGTIYKSESTTYTYTTQGWQRTLIDAALNDTDYRMGVYVDEILDIDLDGIQDGDVLRYDASADTWVAAEMTGGSTGVGYSLPTQGTAGDGWTGASYSASTGVITFTSNDGLGFSTGDLRGPTGPQGTPGG